MNLEELRDRIDRIDEHLVGLVAERVRVARAIGRHKRDASQPVVDPEREAFVIGSVRHLAIQQNLDPTAIEALFRAVIDICRKAQSAPPGTPS